MAWQDLFAALALMLVFEGMFPFLNPRRYRDLLRLIEQMDDAAVRRVGLVSMLLGLGLLYLVR